MYSVKFVTHWVPQRHAPLSILDFHAGRIEFASDRWKLAQILGVGRTVRAGHTDTDKKGRQPGLLGIKSGKTTPCRITRVTFHGNVAPEVPHAPWTEPELSWDIDGS